MTIKQLRELLENFTTEEEENVPVVLEFYDMNLQRDNHAEMRGFRYTGTRFVLSYQ